MICLACGHDRDSQENKHLLNPTSSESKIRQKQNYTASLQEQDSVERTRVLRIGSHAILFQKPAQRGLPSCNAH